MPERPSAHSLWMLATAEGGTVVEVRDRYLALMREHGLIVPREPGDTSPLLPCGWPKD